MAPRPRYGSLEVALAEGSGTDGEGGSERRTSAVGTLLDGASAVTSERKTVGAARHRSHRRTLTAFAVSFLAAFSGPARAHVSTLADGRDRPSKYGVRRPLYLFQRLAGEWNRP